MIKWFISHQWKDAKRSSMWQKNLVINIVLGFFVFLIILEALVGGIVLGKNWHEIFPNDNPVEKFNSYLIYYFAFDLIIRFFMQQVPVLKVTPYLHLPIKRSKIINHVLSKTLFNFFNFLPLFIVIPIAVFQVSYYHSIAATWVWFLSVLFMILSNNFLLVYLKKQFASNPKVVGIFGLILAGLILLDYFGIYSFSGVSSIVFTSFINNFTFIIIPIAVLSFVYIINYRYLNSGLYPEEIRIHKEKKIDRISDNKYLKTLGKTGDMIAVELKLLLRHKRTKTILYMTPLFLLYGLFFYPQEEYHNGYSFLIFIGVFVSGGLMMNYANYSFSYESNYFDAILTNNYDLRKYLKVKFMIAISMSSISFFLTIPYFLFGMDILLINFVCFLYNIGCLSILLLYLATYNKKRMDLGKGSAFNYQGMGASNWLVMFPAFLLPIFVYLPFGLTGNPYGGILVIGIIGMIGLIFHKTFLNLVLKNLIKRKYIMAEGFREK